MHNTKIVATLGPATDAPGVLKQMLSAGVDVFRLNASHGEQDQHAARIDAVRALTKEMRIHAGILLDLQGPKIRLGRFENGGCALAEGSSFTITTEQVMGTAQRASTGYARFARDVKSGDRVLLADGSVELRAVDSDGTNVRCEVVNGGVIGDHKGINLPGVQVSIPSLTEKDLADLHFGLNAGVDLFALSFVRTADDVRGLRERLGGRPVSIVSKIEKPEGWQNIEEILDVTDGVMVARGDLGVEMRLEEVPRIQKSIIRRARRKGRFVITATQMLESMIDHPSPTRAEVSDVANAIYDGSDAVMLSGETAVGKFPVQAAETMARIAKQAESTRRFRFYKDLVAEEKSTYPEIIAQAAYQAAKMAGVAAIGVFTKSGVSARLISRLRPPVPIFAFTPQVETARQLALSYGVTSALVKPQVSTDEMLAQIDKIVLERGWLKRGDGVVSVAGQPVGQSGSTNMLKLHRVGDTSDR